MATYEVSNPELQWVRVWGRQVGAWFFRRGCNGFVMMCGFDFALMRRVLSFFFFLLCLSLSLFPIQRDLYHVCKVESKCGDTLDLV